MRVTHTQKGAIMPRTEIELMEGWEFTRSQTGDEESCFHPVMLPHDWVIGAPFNRDMEEGAAQGFRERMGIGWYRRTLVVPQKKTGYRYYLDFGGIFENSTVWVNDREAGGRKYGYSSFRLDVTDLVKGGENRIVVKADNTASPADRW